MLGLDGTGGGPDEKGAAIAVAPFSRLGSLFLLPRSVHARRPDWKPHSRITALTDMWRIAQVRAMATKQNGLFCMTFDLWWLTYPVLGAVVGFFAGLLGVGGGGIMVPILTTLFLAQGFPLDQVVHMALGTSMAAIVLTSVSSLRAHHAHGAVRWDVVRRITPGILIGTFGATFVASRVDTAALAIFFAVFMAYVSIQMLLNIKPKPSRDLPGTAGMTVAGLSIGGVSALVAIGGGSLSVPFMTWCNVPIHKAVGTSSALGFPIALAGTVGYLVAGWNLPAMPPGAIGYLYWPGLVVLSIASMAMAPLGARVAHSMDIAPLKRAFAVVLYCLAAYFVLR